ncbi:uncharacterized protein LOC121983618 [Zingiber officinale]|uniref:uncharacterized protein LOC121983618 n=1 Tax=Zingiber officinale TaxID=94328 RepID=UPI001C4CC06F|nr:uncharacterized protein LOC121983618 [Zingiber officinale]
MARLPADSDKLGPRSTETATKLEIDDASDDDERPRIKKRSKTTVPNLKYVVGSVLDDPSPLGLRLRKSPSLVDLIQMKLSQANAAAASSFGSLQAGNEKELKSSVISGSTPDKMKASNFPMSLLRIGSWERVSKYEGDLVAKCYFAKHKLVWEVLEGSLKSKIEIQWTDITFLKMACAEDGIESLDIVLAKPPLFFRETDPQPRKHTLWQPTQDFTSGQASMFRRHFLQCSYGFLRKNIEKIAHCDPRLNSLWLQQDVTLDPPNLETQLLFFEDQDDSESHDLIEKEDYRNGSSLSNSFFTATSLMSSKNEPRNFVERRLNHALTDSPLPHSGVNSLCCQFQKDAGTNSIQAWHKNAGDGLQQDAEFQDELEHDEFVDQKPFISRIESFGELLMLPRVTSIPQFFFNISEDKNDDG